MSTTNTTTPTIYKATYSGVPVYEYPCKNVAVMKRMSDGWVNSTHILKVAGFDKPQRTRILEREVQRGTHEKVQGGYGKYQGTWVPVDRAREVAQQYEVLEPLEPLFSYVPSENSPPPAPKHASKAKSAARTASSAALDSPGAAPKKRKTSTLNKQPDGRGRGRPPKVQSINASIPNFEDDAASLSADSASVSSRSSSPSEFMSDNELDDFNNNNNNNNDYGKQHDEYTAAMSMHNRQFMDSDMIASQYSNKLLDFFMAPEGEKVPDFLIHPPPEFDINQVIDDEGHTAFHWACSMGILKIIEVLKSSGADVLKTNNMGQTPLMRAVMFTNCFDRRTFSNVVELLRDTIFYIDPERRTILHHIAVNTSSRSKLSSARYYTEIILAKLSETQPMHELTAYLDRQDVNGDTALHIAARHQARKLSKVLLSYHASIVIQNKSGMTAYDHLIQDAAMRKILEADPHHHAALKSSSSPTAVHGNDGARGQQQQQNAPQQQQPEQTNGEQHNNIINTNQPNGNGQMNGGYGRPMAYPHVAESAIKATQQLMPAMADQIEALANAYDTELKEKNTDMEQVQNLLTEMNEDIASTEDTIRQHESQMGEEQLVKQQLEQGKELVTTRMSQLKKLVERTQARDLASLVQEEESKIDQTVMTSQESYDTLLELSHELGTLQQSRKNLVQDITELHANAGVGDKMNDYRRLLSKSCGVPMEKIDDMLDSIAQALTEINADDVDEQEAAEQEQLQQQQQQQQQQQRQQQQEHASQHALNGGHDQETRA